MDVTFAQVIPLRSLSIPGVHRGLLSLREKKPKHYFTRVLFSFFRYRGSLIHLKSD